MGVGFSAFNIVVDTVSIGVLITTPLEENIWDGELVRETLLFGVFIIVINILILLYLTRPHVRDYFKKRKKIKLFKRF